MSDIALAEVPLWLQGGTYSARLDRTLIDALFVEGVVSGLGVGPRGAGANLSVDIAPGVAVVTGDNQADQGKYLARSTATVNMPTVAVPAGAGQKRIDVLVVAVQDPNAGGAAGNNAVFRWVQGTPTTGTPAAPAVPVSALALAQVLLTNGQASVTASSITRVATGASDTTPIGAVLAFAGSTPPTRYLLCDGAALSRTTYAALFGVIGTSYGAGDGSTTFNLPNFKGRTLVGRDAAQTEFDGLGETGGAKSHVLTQAEMPVHGHGATVNDPGHDHPMTFNQAPSAFGNSFIAGSSAAGSTLTTAVPIEVALTGVGVVIGTAGSSGAHNNLQPYSVCNFIIRAQ